MPESATTPQQEAAAFTDLIEKAISQFGGDASMGSAVEAAIIELEVQHTRHVNAVKREFNDDLERLEKSQKHNLSVLAEREEDNARRSERKLHDITEDYKRQLASSSESYQSELTKMKLHYENMLAEKEHHTKSVARLQEDHGNEIKRLIAEHQRIMENKDKEIDALNRKLGEMISNANTEITEMDTKRRMCEDENSSLRREIGFATLALSQKDDVIADLLRRGLDENERVMGLCKRLMSDVLTTSAEVEVELSKMRAAMIGNNYESIRRRIRESEMTADEKKTGTGVDADSADEPAVSPSNFFAPANVKKALESMEAAEAEGKANLELLIDTVRGKQAAQKDLITVCEARVDEELSRSREEYRKQQEELDQERARRDEANLEASASRRGSGSFTNFIRATNGNNNRSGVVFAFKDADGKMKDVFIRRASRGPSVLSLASNGAPCVPSGTPPSPAAVKETGTASSTTATAAHSSNIDQDSSCRRLEMHEAVNSA